MQINIFWFVGTCPAPVLSVCAEVRRRKARPLRSINAKIEKLDWNWGGVDKFFKNYYSMKLVRAG